VQHTECGGRARRRLAAAGHHVLQRADGRQDHRQAQLLAQHRGAGIDSLDVAQDARAEGEGVDGETVPLLGGLGLGAAHQVVPRALWEVAPRRRDELVQDGKVRVSVHSGVSPQAPRGATDR
jgi:hypothetical protein